MALERNSEWFPPCSIWNWRMELQRVRPIRCSAPIPACLDSAV